ncbi:hypothetical protein K493DRAFT_313003 [Basidiobolus meristosporus CBS 931.73]|uniref:Uncharacterized protein n=1 Tax=Basidiobolus meristosporus CBS 931.73 TaxID=1314790 RepID=A0A1Y1YQ02_9FUNG|nr:hypothetical protein K493DRAFT_313003 [Basidiobolus meristosporus CBS 931.73]|eukprot:ORY00046.1 hypothetical protein K493DRAFT_313003 [Basidiobolus meristosporus CBS 931.73]
MAFSKEHLWLKVVNVIVYFYFLSDNIYAVVGPENVNGPYTPDAKHPTYITPAPFAFAAYGLTHFLLLGFIIYQWFDTADDVVKDGVGWWFASSAILHSLWLHLWEQGHRITSLLIVLFIAGIISSIYHRLKSDFAVRNWADALFVHAPFSIYHAWIVVVAVVNAFAAFTRTHVDGPSTLQVIFVIFGLVFLGSTGIGYTEYKKGDLVGAFVIAWSLLAIFVQQHEPAIHWTALGLSIAVLIYSVKPLVSGRASEAEQAPLLG